MAEAAATRGDLQNISARTDARASRVADRAECVAEIRARLEAEYAQHFGRLPQRKQAAAMTATLLWLERCRAFEGPRIVRSVPQIARALSPELGWHVPRTIRATQQHFGNRVRRQLRYLAALGYLEGYRGLRRPNGQGIGLEIRLTPRRGSFPGKAALPRRRRPGEHGRGPPPGKSGGRRASHAGGRLLLRPQLSAPYGVKAQEHRTAVGARARAPGRRDRAALIRRCRAALEARAANGDAWEGGSVTLAALPWLVDVPVTALARIAFAQHHDALPAISAKRQRQLEQAVARFDRCAEPGVGVALVLDLIRGSWADDDIWPVGWGRDQRPRSLGAIAVCARRLSLKWARTRRRGRGARSAANPGGPVC